MPLTVRIPAAALRRPVLRLVLFAALLPLPLAIMATACSDATSDSAAASGVPPAAVGDLEPTAAQAAPEQAAERRAALAQTTSGTALDMIDLFNQPWSGDLDGMIEREVIRVLVPSTLR